MDGDIRSGLCLAGASPVVSAELCLAPVKEQMRYYYLYDKAVKEEYVCAREPFYDKPACVNSDRGDLGLVETISSPESPRGDIDFRAMGILSDTQTETRLTAT